MELVGPSYNLDSRAASVQRTINMVPVPLEPGNERAGWVFKDVPGLVSAVSEWVPSYIAARAITSSTSVPSGAFTVVSFSSSQYNDGVFSLSQPTRLTAPRAGTYIVDAAVFFAINATGNRAIQIRKNGADVLVSFINPSPGDNTGGYISNTANMHVCCIVQMVTGDYVEALAFQDSGSSLTLPVASFSIAEVQP